MFSSRFLILLVCCVTSAAGNCPDPSQYFTASECDDDQYCETPEIYNNHYVCGKLFSLDGKIASEWEEVTVECTNNGLLVSRGTDSFAASETTLLRCAKKQCTKSPMESKAPCFPENSCSLPFMLEPNWRCPDGTVFEAFYKTRGVWGRPEYVMCAGDEEVLKTRNPLHKDEELGGYRCRTDSGCGNMDPYFNPKDCESKCDKPYHKRTNDPTIDNLVCWVGTLQALRATWVNVEGVVCADNMYKVLENGVPTDERPPQFRCRIELSCELIVKDIAGISTCDAGECTSLYKDGDQTSLKCSRGYSALPAVLEARIDEYSPWYMLSKLSCNKKDLLAESNGVADSTPYKEFRCRIGGDCDLDNLYNQTYCSGNEICEKPNSTSYSCGKGFIHEYASVITTPLQWKRANSMSCDSSKRFKITINGRDSAEVALKVRCVKSKACKMEHYYDGKDCLNNYCTTPQSPKGTQTSFTCPRDQSFQFRIDSSHPWTNTEQVTCDRGRSIVVTQSNTPVYDPERVRCARFQWETLYDASDCDEAHICEPHSGITELSCPIGSILQVKKTPESKFEVVSNMSCKTQCKMDKVVGIPHRIRCAKLKCSTCPDPCPGCYGTEYATSWDKCATTRCNTSVLLIRRDNENIFTDRFECATPSARAEDSLWKPIEDLNDKLNKTSLAIKGDIQCLDKILCNETTPIKSDCGGRMQCKPIPLDNKDHFCPRMIRVAVDGKRREGSKLSCDEKTGQWMFFGFERELIPVGSGDNLYCEYEICDFERFCEECEAENRADAQYFWCPPNSSNPMYRHDRIYEWKPIKNKTGEFRCDRTSFITDPTGYPLQKTVEIDCNYPVDAVSSAALGTIAGYALLGIFGVPAFVVVVLYCVCWLSKKRWFHQVAQDRLNSYKQQRRQAARNKENRVETHSQPLSGGLSVSRISSKKNSSSNTSPGVDTPTPDVHVHTPERHLIVQSVQAPAKDESKDATTPATKTLD